MKVNHITSRIKSTPTGRHIHLASEPRKPWSHEDESVLVAKDGLASEALPLSYQVVNRCKQEKKIQ